MAKNEYVIYHCLGIDEKGKKLERIFKLPSFWEYELLGIALATLSEETIKIKVLNEGHGYSFDFRDKASPCGLELRELEDSDLDVTLYHLKGNKTYFKCKKIGIDIVKNTITRTTPIIISCNDIEDPEKRIRMFFTIAKEAFMYD